MAGAATGRAARAKRVVFTGSDDGSVYAIYSPVPESAGVPLAATLAACVRRLLH